MVEQVVWVKVQVGRILVSALPPQSPAPLTLSPQPRVPICTVGMATPCLPLLEILSGAWSTDTGGDAQSEALSQMLQEEGSAAMHPGAGGAFPENLG